MANTTGKKFGGRVKGTPNNSTIEAREAISAFVDKNSHKLQKWLDEVADGVMDEGEYIVKPDPEKAFSLFQSVIEYHVPKLSRSEVKAEVSVSISDKLAGMDEV